MQLSDHQIAVLAAICDAFVPSVARADDADGFWKRNASDLGVAQVAVAVLAGAPEDKLLAFAGLLDLLGSPGVGDTWGGPAKGFLELDAAEREALLLAWKSSPIEPLRAGYTALASTALGIYYGYADEHGNPSWPSIGYPGPISAPPRIDRPIRPLLVEDNATLDCDTVVVGSGAGGGVVAGVLAEAGHDVIVIEKGPYVAEDGFTQRELEMMLKLYEQGGFLKSKNEAIGLLAGSCLGGGTTINWTGFLRTPEYVLEEWTTEHGNAHFLSPAFRESQTEVERVCHVDTDETYLDVKAEKLRAGAQALGYEVNPYPRNVQGCDRRVCGYCNFGCQKGAKRGTLKTFLQSAFERGARILADTEVERVVVEAGKAAGVVAVQRAADGSLRKLSVRARRVIVACGSIHTPALLVRSGLRHEQIGRNLFIHPATSAAAWFAEPVRSWESMMPLACDEFRRIDGNYGVKLVNAPLHPMWLVAVPWNGGEDHKRLMLKSAHLTSLGAFVRERDSGRVEVDSLGRPVIDYWPSEYDLGHMVRGVQEASRILFAAGAESLLLPNGQIFECNQGKTKLEQVLSEMPGWAWEPHRFGVVSAHQMGTCRMGADAARHPVTPEGETREVKNLFVADASTFPTCSGANPMPSIMAIAHYTARGIAGRG